MFHTYRAPLYRSLQRILQIFGMGLSPPSYQESKHHIPSHREACVPSSALPEALAQTTSLLLLFLNLALLQSLLTTALIPPMTAGLKCCWCVWSQLGVLRDCMPP